MSELIIDGHSDIAWNKLALNRDLLDSVQIKRNAEGSPPSHSEGSALIGFPELEEANIRVIFSTIWTQPENSYYPAPGPKFTTQQEANNQAEEQLQYYVNLTDDNRITIVTGADRLDAVLRSSNYKLGLVLLMEGADPIASPSDLNYWVKNGVRIIGPIWQSNKYGGGTESNLPLTLKGRELIAEMERAGIILDLAHMNDRSAYQALEAFHGVVINSHSNCRTLVDGSRQISDELISEVASRGGVIGIMPWAPLIKPLWNNASKKQEFNLADVVDHVDHIFHLTGSTKHVGIGSSFDGGFGNEQTPREIDTIADMPRLEQALSERGFTQDDIRDIMYKNWLRILTACLK